MAISHPTNFSGKCGTRSFMGMSTIAERSFGCDRGDNVWKHHSENSLPHNGDSGRWQLSAKPRNARSRDRSNRKRLRRVIHATLHSQT